MLEVITTLNIKKLIYIPNVKKYLIEILYLDSKNFFLNIFFKKKCLVNTIFPLIRFTCKFYKRRFYFFSKKRINLLH